MVKVKNLKFLFMMRQQNLWPCVKTSSLNDFFFFLFFYFLLGSRSSVHLHWLSLPKSCIKYFGFNNIICIPIIQHLSDQPSIFLFLFYIQVNRGRGLVGFNPQFQGTTRGAGTTGVSLEPRISDKLLLTEFAVRL